MELRSNQFGFTLVELAIVMIIIGLLIGGILKGQEMIMNARLTATYNAVLGYRAAVETFRDKYDAFPGDMANPGARLSGCAANAACRNGGGNQDGFIGTPNIANWSRDDQSGLNTEATQMWAHLSLADMISGVSVNNQQAWGGMYPAAPIEGGFQVFHANEVTANRAFGHYLMLRLPPSGNAHPDVTGNAVLSPNQVSNLERKYDDNRGPSGTIITDDDGSLCWAVATGIYNEQNHNQDCLTAFKL